MHPRIIANQSLREALHQPFAIEEARAYKLCFLGNQLPTERKSRLQQCWPIVRSLGESAYWNVFGGDSGNRAIDPPAYLQVLSQSDFTISPPGWGGYAHRTDEAILRGSVPILEDPLHYDLPLKDGVNCVIANPTDWGAAVTRAVEMKPQELLSARYAVKEIGKSITVDAMIDRLSKKLPPSSRSSQADV